MIDDSIKLYEKLNDIYGSSDLIKTLKQIDSSNKNIYFDKSNYKLRDNTVQSTYDWSVCRGSWGSDNVLRLACKDYLLMGNSTPSMIIAGFRLMKFESVSILDKSEAGLYAFAIEYVPASIDDIKQAKEIKIYDNEEVFMSFLESCAISKDIDNCAKGKIVKKIKNL